MNKVDINTMPMYCISLDRRQDRWLNFQQRAKPAGIQNRVQRWSATDAKAFDAAKHPQVSVGTAHNIKFKTRRSHYEIDTPGAVGASLSHFGIWERVVQSGPTIVFEDDTQIPTDFMACLGRVVADLPPQWDLIIFQKTDYEGTGAGCRPISGEEPWHLSTALFGCYAYMISPQGASRLLKRAYPIELHVDAYMAYMCRIEEIRMLWHPAMNIPFPEEDSDIYHGGGQILNVPTDMRKQGIVAIEEIGATGMIAVSLVAGGLLALAFFGRGRK